MQQLRTIIIRFQLIELEQNILQMNSLLGMGKVHEIILDHFMVQVMRQHRTDVVHRYIHSDSHVLPSPEI